MNYRIEFKKSAFKELKSLPIDIQKNIADVLEVLMINPSNKILNTKKIKGYKHLYRIRTGEYRILYTLLNRQLTIEIIRVGHRSHIYNKL